MSFQEYSESLRSRLRTGDINPAMAAGLAAVAAALIVALATGIMGILSNPASADDEDPAFEIEKAVRETNDAPDEIEPATICVYVSGEVANAGICYLHQGSRVAEAIEAVGGPTADANLENTNLARILEDGEHISIPSNDEIEAQRQSAIASAADASAGTAGSGHERGGSQTLSSDSANPKVNINSATISELQTLSGIGKAKAEKIVSYREANGPFASIDELTKVSGVGEKTLENIRDAICVN